MPEDDSVEADVGGLWMIGEVEVVESDVGFVYVQGRKSSSRKRRNMPRAGQNEIKNNFLELKGQFRDKNNGQIVKLGEQIKDIDIMHVETTGEKLTRQSAMDFNEANVKKPLASAAAVTRAGNRIVMEEDGGYIENKTTGERMKVRVERNTYVYDV